MKSTNRRCAQCKKKIKAEDALIGGLRAFCSYEHLAAYQTSERGKKVIDTAVKKERRQQDSVRRERLKTRGEYMREAQAAFNAYVRWRDRSDPCISCGVHVRGDLYGGNIDAGHYLARGSMVGSSLRFHLWNTHAQCVKCNRYKAGAVGDYRVGLIWKIGHEKVEWLENNDHKPEFSIEYLKRVRDIFRRKLKTKMKLNSQKC